MALEVSGTVQDATLTDEDPLLVWVVYYLNQSHQISVPTLLHDRYLLSNAVECTVFSFDSSEHIYFITVVPLSNGFDRLYETTISKSYTDKR